MSGADIVHYKKINFDREFVSGRKAYERVVGQWWHGRSTDAPHAHAYRRIAGYAHAAYRRSGGTVVDYACGSGNLMSRLVRQFHGGRFIGIDGSALMLRLARERLDRLGRRASRRVEFIHTELPDPTLPKGVADLVVYAFPNMLQRPGYEPQRARGNGRHRRDSQVARFLASAREPDPEDETTDETPDELYESLMADKAVARNIRRLLRRGGLCVRVEYSDALRTELTDLDQARTAFEEGSLARSFGGPKPEQLFRVVRSTYSRSRVIEDVYHQTRKLDDRLGGYMISVLQAI
jgi:SAM-dependent methyltransferase